jgi:crossover junction endodeoxyribonuclease RuvC
MEGYYNSSQIIAGIDLSLRRTGLMIINSAGDVLHRELIIPKAKLKGIARLKFIKDEIIERLNRFQVTTVAIEGYSFGSSGRATFSIGEAGGVVRLALLENNYPFTDISPSSLKAFLTDNGLADKIMVQKSIEDVYKIYFEDDNEADAYGLARMLLCLGSEIAKYSEKGGTVLIRKIRLKLAEEGKRLI